VKNKREKLVEPVIEQIRKCKYEPYNLTEKGQIVGRVYRRQPLFETMLARGDIGQDEAQALRYYRERYELSHHSLTRSCLNPSIGGGGRDYFGGLSPLTTRANQEVDLMENAAGLFVSALRGVAIEDMSFNRIAIERYGSKQVTIGGRERIVPRSKQHARRVRSEFYAALKFFMPAAQSFYISNFFVDFSGHALHKRIICGNASTQETRRKSQTHIAPRHQPKKIAVHG
jgi:integrase